jgi:hypothetical protein
MKRLVFSVQSISIQTLLSQPPHVIISFTGQATSTGWSLAELSSRFNNQHAAKDGIYEFDFVAEPPKEISLPVLTPIAASFELFPKPNDFKGVRIYAQSNFKEQMEISKAGVAGLDANTKRTPNEAIGYSESFSFDEAFQEAVKNLPASMPPYPDYLSSVVVIETGAVFGGIAGIRKLYVKVREL